ncbi:MAG: prepilin-type N-terminal cleavage/methylation domain-containing protein [Candidatus Faecisoma sp.]|nr:prepilin-type N-terminal cleavage/methylation domain-containing protein [Candidatus Faecisoma sp.]
MKNKKKKIGFTLIELLAVIIVLAIIALIATPIIFNVIENAKIKSLENSCYGVIDAVRTNYAEGLLNSEDGTVKLKGSVKEITVAGEQPIAGKWEIDNSSDSDNRGIKIKDVKFGSMKDYTCTNVNSDGTINSKVTCTKGGSDGPVSEYIDNSGANKPELFNNMKPIKYENEKWLVANTSQKWYDYDAKEWANAVVLNSGVTKNVGDEVTEEEISLWYVWIPRYKYKKFSNTPKEQEISVIFENGTSTTGTGENVTHPAFTFGSTELTGFWVGKFEVSGSTSEITVKPNVTSLRSQIVSSFFTAIQNVKTTYGINNADSHMMKNMEWGAVAYLKQSQYGLGTTDIAVNTNSNFYTGGGQSDAYKTNVAQSTTGNIYGIYDMSGGAFEYVMGNYNDTISNTGFSSMPAAKYYDKYTSSTGKTGDATTETSGWYGDQAIFPNSSNSWFHRGGYYGNGSGAGVFGFHYYNGYRNDFDSARAVLSAP